LAELSLYDWALYVGFGGGSFLLNSGGSFLMDYDQTTFFMVDVETSKRWQA